MQLGQRFADAEHADHHRDEADAAPKFDYAEGETFLCGQWVKTDGTDEKAKAACEDSLDEAFARKRTNQQNAKDCKQHVIARLEGEREFRNGRCCNGQNDDADESANERHHGGDPYRLPRQAFLRQWIAVECSRDG